MASVLDPVVLLTLASVVVLFAAVFRYQWGSLPPARALVVVAAALFWFAYSLTQLSSFLAPPHDDLLFAFAALLVLCGAILALRWWRRRGTSESA